MGAQRTGSLSLVTTAKKFTSAQLLAQNKKISTLPGLANQPHLATNTYQEDEYSSSTGQIA